MRYDYVIVGGGAAGCVLANRLSARADRQVLLLEAGPRDTHPFIHMPKGIGKILADPRHVWPFPVHAAEGSNAPPATWVRGKTLGGSSSINGMMYVRGQPADFAALAALTSADWDWEKIGAVYAEAERHPLGAAATRGASGPLKVSLPRPHPVLERLIASAATLGLAPQPDINAPDDAEKVGYCPQTIWHGRRQSAAVAFLQPVLDRANLRVVTGVTADRVIFDGRRAVAVEALVDGARERFEGTTIILSGGTFGSPAILQRSGIGDAARLAALGIACVVDRPAVGRHLREHCALAMQWRLRDAPSQNAQYSGWRLLLNGVRYYLARSGPLASASYDLIGWFRSRPGLDRPDVQFIAAPFSIDKSRPGIVMERKAGMQLALYPLRPRSEGELHITTTDPHALPAASLDYFADAEDRATMIAGLRFVRRMMAADPVARIIARETRPGPAVESDEEILDTFRTLGTPAYHATGTCRMGDDADAVVDPLTRVRGVAGLHVVDLSIAPFIVAGNTFAPVMAMAWRAADLIEQARPD